MLGARQWWQQRAVDGIGVSRRAQGARGGLNHMVAVLADPLLAAAALRALETRAGAARVWQRHAVWAQRHATQHSIHATALVLAAGLEVLAVLVEPPAELAWPALCFCCGHRRK